jgi:hypothetical protein
MMRNMYKECFTATDVLIEFEDGPVSFRIRDETTFADISEIVDGIRTWRKGDPIFIDVRFKVLNDNGLGRSIASPLISSPIF